MQSRQIKKPTLKNPSRHYSHAFACSALVLAMSGLTGCASDSGNFSANNPTDTTTTTVANTNTNTGATNTGTTNTGTINTGNANNAGASTGAVPKDVLSTPRNDDDKVVGAYGEAMPVLRRNFFKNTEPQADFDKNQAKVLGNDIHTKRDELFGMTEANAFVDSHDKQKPTRTRDYQFVRTGYALDAEAKLEFIKDDNKKTVGMKQGATGFVYYQGTNPAKELPAGKATYEGHWDFATNAKSGRKDAEFFEGSAGDTNSATPLQATAYDGTIDGNLGKDGTPLVQGFVSKFDVDFANKELTGKLVRGNYVNPSKKEQTVDELYDINAKIQGNRFMGSATAKNKDDIFFGQDSSAVEGGFFGDKAQELAGKFLTDDNSLYAVFSAKTNKNAIDSAKPAFDADVIEVGASQIVQKALDTFGNATKLVLNGQSIALVGDKHQEFAMNGKTYNVNFCCEGYNYVRFGDFSQKDGDKTLSLFVQGERAPASALPTGKVSYVGTWAGLVEKKAGVRYVDDGAPKFTMNVDFAGKTFLGELFTKNATTSFLSLKGAVDGTGFNGVANTTKEFNLDPNGTGGSYATIKDAKVMGGFYGPKAEEVGGHIFGNASDKIAVVFGGKRQQ